MSRNVPSYANPEDVGAPFHLYSQVSVAGFYAAREQYFADGEYPPNTLLIVKALVRPELRVEIDAPARLL
jgi:enamine deaminase RidA (YjgF/YER057c/UK114 family)